MTPEERMMKTMAAIEAGFRLFPAERGWLETNILTAIRDAMYEANQRYYNTFRPDLLDGCTEAELERYSQMSPPECFQALLRAEKAQRWRSVESEPPDRDGTYIVVRDDLVMTDDYHQAEDWWEGCDFGLSIPILWQPAPPLPPEENDG